MASNSDMIKEFLVGLGFKIDETSLRKFNIGISETTKRVLTLGAAVVTTTAAVGTLVASVTSHFEKLYYASQRSGASAANLQALGAAARTAGLSFDQIQGAVESLGKSLRAQPGLSGYLKSLGIDPTTKDSAEVLLQLVGKLREMGPPGSLGFAVAQQIAAQFGIDPDTLVLLTQNYEKLTRAAAEYAKKQEAAGIDADALAEKSAAFGVKLNELEQNFSIITQRITQTFLPVAEQVLDWAINLTQAFIDLDVSTNGWASGLTTVGLSALGAWIAKAILLRTVLKGIASDAAAAAASPGLLSRLFGFLGPVGGFIAGMTPTELNKGEEEFLNKSDAEKHAEMLKGFEQQKTPLGIRQNNPGNLRFWRGVDSMNGFAAFPTPLAGLSAMAKNLLNYATNGIRTIRDIINTWAPSVDGNNVASYIADVVKRTGFAAGDVLNLRDPETLQKLMEAMIHHEQGQQPYDPALIRAAINGRLGLPTAALVPGGASGGGVSITQNTSITVNGASDPDGTARAISGEQDRVNSDLVRNARGAVQ